MNDPQAASSPSAGRMLLPALLLVALAAGGWWLWGRGASEGPPAAPPDAGPRFLNAAPGTAYVGSEACVECHRDEADAHGGHPHARSFGPVEASSALTGDLEHETSAMTYRVDLHDGALRVRGSLDMADGSEEVLSEHALTHWIGSGGTLRLYAAEPEGFLVLAPLARAAGTEGWQIDPACDSTLQPDFSRPLDPACVRCHAGRALQAEGAVHRYRILEHAIGCESCHGPGSLHVERHRTPPGGASPPDPSEAPDLTIANPARMTRQQALAVCARCHMSPALTVPRAGRGPGTWQPAQRWEEAQLTFRPAGRPDAIPDARHVDLLAASTCYQASDTLTCLTCHDAHHAEEAATVRERTRAACVQCHGECGREEPAAKPEAEDCATCHMPAAATRRPHEVFHDHRLGRPGQDAPGEPGEGLEVFLGDAGRLPPAEGVRARAIAAARQTPWFGNPLARTRSERRARALLDEAREAGAADPRLTFVQAMQGHLESQASVSKQTLADSLAALLEGDAAQEVLAPEEVAELRDLFLRLVEMEQGPSDRALGQLQRLVEQRRRAEDWTRLAVQRSMRGDVQGAHEAFLRAREIWPTKPGLQGDAAQSFHAQGDAQAARRADRIFKRLMRQQSHVPKRKPR